MAAWTETIKISMDEHGHITIKDGWGLTPRVLEEGDDLATVFAAFGVKLGQMKVEQAAARHARQIEVAQEHLKTAKSRQRSITKMVLKNDTVYNTTRDYNAMSRVDSQITRWVREVTGTYHTSVSKEGSWAQRLGEAQYDSFTLSAPSRKQYDKNRDTLAVLAAYWVEQEQRWANELATEQAA